MAQLTILYWRDIPAQVVVKAGRRTAKRVLEERFEKAIDRAAMRARLRDSDSYLAQWRRGEPQPLADDLAAGDLAAEDLENVAAETARQLEAAYDETRLAALVANGGLEETTPA